MLAFRACGSLNRGSLAKPRVKSSLILLHSFGKAWQEKGRGCHGCIVWMRHMETYNAFVSKDSKDPPIYAFMVPTWANDPLTWIRRNYGGPSIPLEQAEWS